MRLPPGKYFGHQTVQRKTKGLCLTLCQYEANGKLPKHSHEHPGFFFLVAGDHFEEANCRSGVQPESSLLFHSHHSAHETEVGKKGMTGLNIAFNQTWLDEIESPKLRRRDGWLLERPLAKKRALQLLAGLEKSRDESLENFGIELLEMLDVCQGSQESEPPTWLRHVRDRIDADYMLPLSLTSLAIEASVHPVYLARAFRGRYGCTVTDYLHQTRILHALERVFTGMSLGEAAAECGFCDQSYLARIVRAKLGVSPSDLNWFR